MSDVPASLPLLFFRFAEKIAILGGFACKQLHWHDGMTVEKPWGASEAHLAPEGPRYSPFSKIRVSIKMGLMPVCSMDCGSFGRKASSANSDTNDLESRVSAYVVAEANISVEAVLRAANSTLVTYPSEVCGRYDNAIPNG